MLVVRPFEFLTSCATNQKIQTDTTPMFTDDEMTGILSRGDRLGAGFRN
jgi:hypothetical protein